ncbi:hypothetical protein CISG_06107 [Coccidioides immitis RMSCC 3703]|uniref:Uncharacterized protein n=1 Tax=Coccidioides immitis RMSCC 3703 TaxID=454286 RepID=A0A0J8QWL2_COCIT|nr:hypothetical protein CISG_06107 [Coccidioides immitis RMSCC 3703]
MRFDVDDCMLNGRHGKLEQVCAVSLCLVTGGRYLTHGTSSLRRTKSKTSLNESSESRSSTRNKYSDKNFEIFLHPLGWNISQCHDIAMYRCILHTKMNHGNETTTQVLNLQQSYAREQQRRQDAERELEFEQGR